ncbi:hypothetical protein [Streptomyces sp. NPDC056796]|uniref:hypothetical protein n=1 Tax=Streptomyces sp. NPDC056796 TaxID=3345947 RepID=UPI003676812D
MINYSDPRALDRGRVRSALDAAVLPDTRTLVVEGTFALLPALTRPARWSVYIDAPADLRLARKILRKISEGADPEISLRGYLAYGREAHTRYVAPTQRSAELVLDGTQPTSHLVRRLHALLNAEP